MLVCSTSSHDTQKRSGYYRTYTLVLLVGVEQRAMKRNAFYYKSIRTERFWHPLSAFDDWKESLCKFQISIF